MSPPRWVTVATFDDPYHARLARTLLDAADIATRLRDDHIVDAVPLYAVAVGGVKLCVPEADVLDAEAVLASVETASGTTRTWRAGWGAVLLLMFWGVLFLIPLWLWAVALVGALVGWIVCLGEGVARASRTPGPPPG